MYSRIMPRMISSVIVFQSSGEIASYETVLYGLPPEYRLINFRSLSSSRLMGRSSILSAQKLRNWAGLKNLSLMALSG